MRLTLPIINLSTVWDPIANETSCNKSQEAIFFWSENSAVPNELNSYFSVFSLKVS